MPDTSYCILFNILRLKMCKCVRYLPFMKWQGHESTFILVQAIQIIGYRYFGFNQVELTEKRENTIFFTAVLATSYDICKTQTWGKLT